MNKRILSLLSIILTSFSVMAQSLHLNEDFNGNTLPTGWTNNSVSGTSDWNFGIDAASAGGNQNIDGTELAYFDDDFLGSASTDNSIELISPTFNSTTFGATYLDFDYNFRQFTGIADSFFVDVFNGTSWIRVLSENSDNCGNWTCSPYPHARINITAHVNAACRVRFSYHDGNDWGWYVGLDNVVISSPLNDDIGVSSILTPVSSCGLTSSESVTVRIKNFGANPANNFPVSYRINGGAAITETVTTSIIGGDSLDYTFVATTNLSTIGTYNLDSYTTYAIDGSATNDSSVKVVVNNAAYQPTYIEGFESGLGGWIISGNNPSWAIGSPNSGQINTAGSGTSSLVTNLNGPYNNSELSYVTSPCLDFSQLTADPLLSFALNYNTENGFDRLWVEYSIDEGATWTKVATNSASTNWYSNTTGNYWSGSNSSWNTSESTISNTFGNSKVYIRFVFQSDGSVSLAGVGLDNIAIRAKSNVDIELKSLDGPTNSTLCGYGSNEFITATVINKGGTAISSFDAGYQVSGQTVVLQNGITPPSAIQPNASFQFTFAQPANLSAVSNFNLDVWAKVAGDGFIPNDTLKNAPLPLTSGAIALTPYIENFDGFSAGSSFSNTNDAINGGWTRSTSNGYVWRVGVGTANRSSQTGPDGDHTGNGNFMYTEASGSGNGDVTTLESPCLDFTNLNGAVMTFWWHRYGTQMGDLFVDVYNGSNWVNNVSIISAQPQGSSADPWVEETVSLSQYVGSRIKVRFRSISQGCCAGDMAIDDILIYEPIPQDASLDSLRSPQTGCDLTPNELVSVDILNFGTGDIQKVKVCYSVNNGPPVCDSVQGILIFPGATYTLNMNSQRVNMSTPGNYNLKIWTELNGDTNVGNDTLEQTIVNETILFPACEEFSNVSEPVGSSGFDIQDGKFSNNWVANRGEYSWEISNTGNPGPSTDHSATGAARYMVVDNANGNNGDVAELTSPCYDLTTVSVANLEFWYHQYGSPNNTMFIDVFDGLLWHNRVDSLVGDEQTGRTMPWKKKVVSLANYTGNLINIRFRALRAGGTYALDDICVTPPPNNQVQITDILTPQEDFCFYSNAETVRVRMKNIGANDVDSLQVFVTVDSNTVGNGFAQLSYDSAWIYPGNAPSPWSPGELFVIDLPTTIDLSFYKRYRITVDLVLSGDINLADNIIDDYFITHNEPLQFPYIEGFEVINLNASGPNYSNGFSRSSGDYEWEINRGLNVPFLPTGPSKDHTFKNGIGKFFTTDASSGVFGEVATLETPCFDLSSLNKPTFKFWYHMYGHQMGELFIDINADKGWVTLDSILGEKQINHGSDWLQHSIDLQAYAGEYAKIRFRSKRGDGSSSNMAIDDLFVYDLSQYDVGPISLVRPGSDNFSCYSDTQSVHVEILNYGAKDLNFANDSLYVEVEILRDGQPWDVMFRTISSHIWRNPQTGVIDSLPSDSTVVVWVNNSADGNGTFDMSQVGSVFTFNVTTSMVRDSIDNNDDFTEDITTQISPGTVVVDNNSICNGSVVELSASGFFGAPKWERMYYLPDGSTFWLPEFGFGSDSATFFVQPDTTAMYRIRICGSSVVSNSVLVDVTVVKVPDPIHDTICGGGLMTVEGFAAPVHGLKAVNWYHNINDTLPFKVTNAAPFTHSAMFTETDTFWLEGVIDSCVSLGRSAVYAVVNPFPVVDLGLTNDTLCQDTNKVLNAGAGFGYNYDWLITGPNGLVQTSNLQTIGVNPLDLMKDSTYYYQVTVTSPFKCVTVSNKINVVISDSCFVGINVIDFNNAISIYPNPTEDKLYINYQNKYSVNADIEIQSIDGKVVWSKNDINLSNEEYELSLGKLTDGVYFVKINSQEETFIQKLIKN